jgi:hypothetical protein
VMDLRNQDEIASVAVLGDEQSADEE